MMLMQKKTTASAQIAGWDVKEPTVNQQMLDRRNPTHGRANRPGLAASKVADVTAKAKPTQDRILVSMNLVRLK